MGKNIILNHRKRMQDSEYQAILSEFSLTNWLIEIRSLRKVFKVFSPSKKKIRVLHMSKLTKMRSLRSQLRL